MNKTIDLVNRWGAFEENHPDGSIEDFCRHLLIQQREDDSKRPLVGGVVPPHSSGLLLKILGRIHKMNLTYATIALAGTDTNQLEEFGMLNTIKQMVNPKKTEVIYSSLMELSSGTDMLNRLKGRGLIEEFADTEDRRSKRLQLTPKGEWIVEECKARISMLADMLTMDMTEDDKKLCIKLLKGVEQKYSSLIQTHKGMTFEEIYAEMTA